MGLSERYGAALTGNGTLGTSVVAGTVTAASAAAVSVTAVTTFSRAPQRKSVHLCHLCCCS